MSYADMATYRADHEEPDYDPDPYGDWQAPCTCTYGAYASYAGGTGWDIAHYDPACPEHGDDELPIAPPCPACFGIEATALGMLGQRLHLRCRNCGMDRSYVLPF